MHLGDTRQIDTDSPCRNQLFKDVFGEELQSAPSSYAGAQFVVAADRIHLREKQFYFDLARRMDGLEPEEHGCFNIPRQETRWI